MINPADEHIANLIHDLTTKASKFACKEDDRQRYINQIAQLRASMNPTIIRQKKS